MESHDGINDGYPHLPVREDTFADVMALATLTRRNPEDVLADAVELLRAADVPRTRPTKTTSRGRKKGAQA